MEKRDKINKYQKGHLTCALIVVALVLVLYCFADKDSFIFFDKAHHTAYYYIFFIMQGFVDILISLIPYAFIYLLIMFFIKRFYNFEHFMFFAIASVFFSSVFVDFLKRIADWYFGIPFIKNDLSLVRNNTHRFLFFRGDLTDTSFISGHAAVVFAAMAVLWMMHPKWRWFSVVSCTVVVVGLLGCNFHFPGDIIAGAFIGIAAAVLVLRASQIYAKNVEEFTRNE
jgi:membrane-associated phospholipid phosphatase